MSCRARVLIVSPSDEVRAVYPGYLRRHGMVVDVAGDVTEAFAKAVENPPAVVAVDDITPGVREYFDQLRDVASTRDTYRLLLVSSLPVDANLAHAAAVLLRPAWPDDFYGKVLRLVLDREDSKERSQR